GRLVIRREDLLAHEEVLRAARRSLDAGTHDSRDVNPKPRRAVRPASRRAASLQPGWWRDGPGGNRDAT
ncbi:MAG: hypothetical protein Q8L55_00860, partial [Phycisphaerales bacterium]|nr:hypothetical protein [Phycisphaerales bacterium]